jgi:hypothetical protein
MGSWQTAGEFGQFAEIRSRFVKRDRDPDSNRTAIRSLGRSRWEDNRQERQER